MYSNALLAAVGLGSPVRVNASSPSMVDAPFLTDIAPVAVEMAYVTGVDIPIAAGTFC